MCVSLSFIPMGVLTLRRVDPVIAAVADRSDAAAQARDAHAAHLVSAANWSTAALIVASAVLTAIWSRRVALNSATAGMSAPRPTLAALGWFIPLGWWFFGFQELYRSARSLQRVETAPRRIRVWQVVFLVATIFGLLSRGLEVSAIDKDLETIVRGQGWMRIADISVFGVLTVFAARAIHDVNRQFALDAG